MNGTWFILSASGGRFTVCVREADAGREREDMVWEGSCGESSPLEGVAAHEVAAREKLSPPIADLFS